MDSVVRPLSHKGDNHGLRAVETPVYCASEKAIAAAALAYPDNDAGRLADALIAVHHPGLGLDRSVCLRDVLRALERDADDWTDDVCSVDVVKDVLAREFGDW